jgi:hypothetical protein
MSIRRFRPVDRYIVRGGCEPLVSRIEDFVPDEAEYVVFDLDRTVHFGVTIGEHLGWEALASARDARADDPLDPYFSWGRPLRTGRNFALGLRRWALAGVIYAATVRLGDRRENWRRRLVLRLGPHYVDRVQTMLRHVLMVNIAGLTREQVHCYVERAWRRWEQRLVVTRELIEEMRRRRPRLRGVLLSSASTQPTVAHAAGKLGVDGYVASEVDLVAAENGEIYSAPAGVPAWFRRERPAYFSRPGGVIHNAAGNKIALLRERYPELFAEGTSAVGVTDNNYGEDRTWSEHFAHVVTLNSRHPFSPFVSVNSPCRSIQVIDAVPAACGLGTARFEWLGTLKERYLDVGGILETFEDHDVAMLESLIADLRVARARIAEAIDGSIRTRAADLVSRIGEVVDRYNQAVAEQKKSLARELDRMGREARRLERAILAAGRDAAAVQHEIESLHQRLARTIVAR